MAEILGLGTTDFPSMRIDGAMSGIFKGLLAGDKLSPDRKNPENWPVGMREEWGEDEGLAASLKVRAHEVEQFRKLRGALDEFKPDLILIWSKDHRESLKKFVVPQYMIQGHEQVDVKLYQNPYGGGNQFGEDPDKVTTIKGHPGAAMHLVRSLQDLGFDPTYSTEAMHPNGFAHTFCGVSVHLDWDNRDFKTPVLPVSIDPFGGRGRGPLGLEPGMPHPLPISPKRAFELGRATARAFKASPWRVALVAGVGWSHTQNTSWEREWIHPDMEEDKKRHDEWANNKFDKWGDNFTVEGLEEHGQWEHVVWIALAGAMTEIGAKVKYSDFQPNYLFNSNWVNSIFEAK